MCFEAPRWSSRGVGHSGILQRSTMTAIRLPEHLGIQRPFLHRAASSAPPANPHPQSKPGHGWPMHTASQEGLGFEAGMTVECAARRRSF